MDSRLGLGAAVALVFEHPRRIFDPGTGMVTYTIETGNLVERNHATNGDIHKITAVARVGNSPDDENFREHVISEFDQDVEQSIRPGSTPEDIERLIEGRLA